MHVGPAHRSPLQAAGATTTAAEEKLAKQHGEINALFSSLSQKINALTNFHFTPPAVHAEIQVTTSAPAISLEEATPGTASAASLLAPEEVYNKSKGVEKADSEKTATDKKRERRAKKKRKKSERLAVERKDKAKADAGQESKKAVLAKLVGQKNVTVIDGKSGIKGPGSSKAFFKEMTALKGVTGKEKKKKKAGSEGARLRL
jgi:U3 small nucleolar RNA-associated protein MPP10